MGIMSAVPQISARRAYCHQVGKPCGPSWRLSQLPPLPTVSKPHPTSRKAGPAVSASDLMWQRTENRCPAEGGHRVCLTLRVSDQCDERPVDRGDAVGMYEDRVLLLGQLHVWHEKAEGGAADVHRHDERDADYGAQVGHIDGPHFIATKRVG